MRFCVSSLVLAAALVLPGGGARAEGELFPPATPACYVGAEVMPIAPGAAPYAKPVVGVSAVRLERSWPQLAYEETREPPNADGRLVSVRTLVTFADAAKSTPKRYEDGRWALLRCKADVCDGGNTRIELQTDGSVLLKMTGGLNIGGGEYPRGASRRLPDGHVYRLSAKDMSACR